MPKVAAATLQTLWDCRWSRPPGNHAPGPSEPGAGVDGAPSGTWVCIRPGGRRPVTEDECEGCEYWESGDTISERDERG